jgi:hypothetical protein
MKKKKKIIIWISVVVFLVAIIILSQTVFYSQLYGQNYSEVKYVSNQGYEIKFPATPGTFSRTVEIRGSLIQTTTTMALLKDGTVYFVDYITFPLNDTQISEDFIRDIFIGISETVDLPVYTFKQLGNWGEIQRFEVVSSLTPNAIYNVIYDPAYESFWVIRVIGDYKKENIKYDGKADAFINSFKLNYVDVSTEKEATSDEVVSQNVEDTQTQISPTGTLSSSVVSDLSDEPMTQRELYNFSINKIGSATDELNTGKDSFSVGLGYLLDKNYSLAVSSFTEALQYYNSALAISETLDTSDPSLVFREDFILLKTQSITLFDVHIQTAELYKSYSQLGVYDLIDGSAVQDFAEADEKLQSLENEAADDFFPTYSAVASKGVAFFN